MFKPSVGLILNCRWRWNENNSNAIHMQFIIYHDNETCHDVKGNNVFSSQRIEKGMLSLWQWIMLQW